MMTWLASLVAGLLGAVAGYALGRAPLGPPARDVLAFVAGAACGLAVVIARAVVFFVTATREHGIAAMGLDPRASLVLVLGAMALATVAVHLAMGRAGAELQMVSPIAIGGSVGAALCWALLRGYWTAG